VYVCSIRNKNVLESDVLISVSSRLTCSTVAVKDSDTALLWPDALPTSDIAERLEPPGGALVRGAPVPGAYSFPLLLPKDRRVEASLRTELFNSTLYY
jgi:hypothetical protein